MSSRRVIRMQREEFVTVFVSIMKIYSNSHRLVRVKHQLRPVLCIFKYQNQLYASYKLCKFTFGEQSNPVSKIRSAKCFGQFDLLQDNNGIFLLLWIVMRIIISLQRSLTMYPSRLSTEELIQQTRYNYDISKYQQRIHELDLTLQLRNKEVQCLTNQLASSTQEHNTRNKQLETDIIHLKQEIAELRVKHVRLFRQQSEQYQKALDALREQHQQQLNHNNQQWQQKYEQQTQIHQAQLKSIRIQYQGFISLEKQEVQICKGISQQHIDSYNLRINQLQEDRRKVILARKEAESKTKTYQDALEIAKNQFEAQKTEKDQTIAKQKAEIEGLKLKHQLLEAKIQQYRKKQQDDHKNDFKLLQLQQINHKLVDDNERLRLMLCQKEEENLKKLRESHHIIPKQIQVNRFQCNHSGLIHQLEANLNLKDKEIQQLKNIIEQWTRAIGFDRPLSQRLSQLAQISQNTKNLNQNWLNKLKSKKQVKSRKKI